MKTSVRVAAVLGGCLGISALIGVGAGVASGGATPAPLNATRGSADMQRVTGIGGILFRSADPVATQRWYREHLGVPARQFEGQEIVIFEWRERGGDGADGLTVWSATDAQSDYLDTPSRRGGEFMINYRVRDLQAMLEQLRAGGVTIVGDVREEFNGRFAWIIDPDGRKVELWQPAPGF